MLQRLSKWAEATYAEDSIPTAATLRRWAEIGLVPGACKLGGRWYVDTNVCKANEVANQAVAALPLEYQGLFD